MPKVEQNSFCMEPFVSTGKFYQEGILETVNKFLRAGHTRLELSCGHVRPDDLAELKNLMKVGMQFRLHNYFPVFGEHFVLNLSSADCQIRDKSRRHVVNAINWSSELESRFFAVHAGFRISPAPEELGGAINTNKIMPLLDAKNIFLEELNVLSDYAKKNGVILLVENNVYSKKNYQKYKENNPFLFCGDGQSMIEIPDNVGLLIDLAHLKVSGNTLNFGLSDTLELLSSKTMGYHYSDNDGESDTNDHIKSDSYLFNLRLKTVQYHTLEVYDDDLYSLHEDINNLQKCKFS
ncbi:MAG: sugar phosphate isomerase/epimerase [Paracoccaceae bacterium]